jgi:hypothetical protein
MISSISRSLSNVRKKVLRLVDIFQINVTEKVPQLNI